MTDDVEFRNPDGGGALRGEDGVRALVAAAEQVNLRVVREGPEELRDDGRVAVPVRIEIRDDDVYGTALFETSDAKVTAFEVRPRSRQ